MIIDKPNKHTLFIVLKKYRKLQILLYFKLVNFTSVIKYELKIASETFPISAPDNCIL